MEQADNIEGVVIEPPKALKDSTATAATRVGEGMEEPNVCVAASKRCRANPRQSGREAVWFAPERAANDVCG
jgi:hypothetical protein